ncbi:hypothetical protein DL763_006509 [Monosporascus cannonballus]|nr:hypothetical protein DL763_006509 [Monosporascus cannonballus]
MKLVGSLALTALMTMVHGSINVTTSAASCINMHGRDDSITWSTSSARYAQTHDAFDAELPEDHNSSTASVMSQSWRTLIYNTTAVHYTKTVTLDLPRDTTTASWSSSLPRFTTTVKMKALHSEAMNTAPENPRQAFNNHARNGYGYGYGYGFANVARRPDRISMLISMLQLLPEADVVPLFPPFRNASSSPTLISPEPSPNSSLAFPLPATSVTRMDTNLYQVLMEAVSQGLESVAHLQGNEIKARQQYRKALIMIELVQRAKEKFAAIDLETAEQLRHLAQQQERKEEVMKEAQGALDAMDGDVFHCLSTMIDNFTAQRQYSQQPTPPEAYLPGEDQHSGTIDPGIITKRGLSQASVELGANPVTPQKGKLALFCDLDLTSTAMSNLCLYIATPKGTKRAATTDGPGEAPARHDTTSTGDIDAEIPSRLSHRARRVRTTSPNSSILGSFHASPKRPNMSPTEPPEASSETMQAQRQESGELGDIPSSSVRTRGSGRPRKSYNVANFYR